MESIFLSLDLNRPGSETVLRKGAREAFRPGIDQLPGTRMEFYMSDDGAARLSPEGGVLIATRDVPMFYTGEMQHHPIRLCDGAAENNARPLNPIQSFCAITKRRIINGRFTAGL